MKLPRKLKKILKRQIHRVCNRSTKWIRITSFEPYRFYYKPSVASFGNMAVTSSKVL